MNAHAGRVSRAMNENRGATGIRHPTGDIMVSKGRLLVVDDVPRNVELIVVRLHGRGYKIVEAFDGPGLGIAEQQSWIWC